MSLARTLPLSKGSSILRRRLCLAVSAFVNRMFVKTLIFDCLLSALPFMANAFAVRMNFPCTKRKWAWLGHYQIVVRVFELNSWVKYHNSYRKHQLEGFSIRWIGTEIVYVRTHRASIFWIITRRSSMIHDDRWYIFSTFILLRMNIAIKSRYCTGYLM